MGVISWLNQHKPITLMGPHVIMSLRCFGDWWLCPPLGGHFLGHSPLGLPRWPVDLDGGGDDGGLPGRLQSSVTREPKSNVVYLFYEQTETRRCRCFRFFFGWVFLMTQMCVFPFLGFSSWFIESLMAFECVWRSFGVLKWFCWFRCWYWICIFIEPTNTDTRNRQNSCYIILI